MFTPKILSTLRGYTREQFVSDLIAGTIVGIVALPLAIAFAIASGVTPDAGLATAIVAGFLISVLGGSRVQIGGPTGAFVVIVYGIVQQHGVGGLAVATMMAGVLLVIMGLARFGGAIKFIPSPVIIGFTSGIAVIIFSGQVGDLLGLRMGDVPADFLSQWPAFAAHLDTINPHALIVGGLSFAVLLGWRFVNRRIPAPFMALVITTILVPILGLEVETIGSRFGEIRGSLSMPEIPRFDWSQIGSLIGPAFTIALLGAIESLLSAVVADGMIGGRHRSNVELIAQGIANIASPLFGGIPATGAIARTATNVRNGGRTPVAGIVHAVVLLLILLFFGRFAALIPLATLAAILMMIAYHMSDWRTFRVEITKAPKSDVAVMLVTFSLTVLVDLTVAIQVGMVLAAFLFMRRMAEVSNVSEVTREFERAVDDYDTDPMAVHKRTIPDGVEVFDVSGPFFFGAADKFRDTLGRVSGRPKVLILRMRNVPAIDSTGMRTLADIIRDLNRRDMHLILSGVHAQPLAALEHAGVLDDLGREHVRRDIDDALEQAQKLLAREEDGKE